MPIQHDTHGQIFRHMNDARAASSVTLAAMIFVLIIDATHSLSPPQKANALARYTVKQSAGTPPSTAVRVVGMTSQSGIPCEQQIWPNIDRRCLVRTQTGQKADNVVPAAEDKAKLSPLTATASVTPAQQAQQDATAGAKETETTPQPKAPVAQAPPREQMPREQIAVHGPAPQDSVMNDDEDDEVQDWPARRITEPVRPTPSRHYRHPVSLPRLFGGFFR